MKTIEDKFKIINEHRTAIMNETFDISEEIEELSLRGNIIMAPHTKIIDELLAEIRAEVVEAEESCKTLQGTCTFVNGSKGSIKWDDAALNGAIAGGGGNLDYLLGFRAEGAPGKPSVRFNMKEI